MIFKDGDIISFLKLDSSKFKKDIQDAVAFTSKQTKKMADETGNALKGITETRSSFYKNGKAQMFETTRKWQEMQNGMVVTHQTTSQRIAKQAKLAGSMWSREWWQHFGRVAVGFTIAYRAMNAIENVVYKIAESFSYGLEQIDQFNLGIIEAAASMQTISKLDPSEGLSMYLKFAKGVYQELEFLAAKHFATGQHLQMAFSKMVSMGVVPTATKQLEQMAQLVDLILIKTKGLMPEAQIRTEIQALIEGNLMRGAVVARMLDQIIPNYRNLVKAMKETGDVGERTKMFFEGISKGLSGVAAISDEVLKTHMAWRTTLISVMNVTLRAGLDKMYKDTVGYMQVIKKALIDQNGLTERGMRIAHLYNVSWYIMKESAKALWDILVSIYKTLNSIIAPLTGGASIIQIMALGAGVFVKSVAFGFKILSDLAISIIKDLWDVLQEWINFNWFDVFERNINKIAEVLKILWSEEGLDFVLQKLKDVFAYLHKDAKSVEEVAEDMKDIYTEVNKLSAMSPEHMEEAEKHINSIELKLLNFLTRHNLGEKFTKEFEVFMTDLQGMMKVLDPAEFMKKLPGMAKVLKEMIDAINKSMHIDVRDSVDQMAKRIAKFNRELTKDLIKNRQERILIEAYFWNLEKRALVNEWQAKGKITEQEARNLLNRIENVYQGKIKVINGTFLEGMQEGLNEWLGNLRTTFESARDHMKECADALKDTFSTVFVDAMRDRLESFTEYVDKLLDALATSIADKLAEIVMEFLAEAAKASMKGTFWNFVFNLFAGWFGMSIQPSAGYNPRSGGMMPDTYSYGRGGTYTSGYGGSMTTSVKHFGGLFSNMFREVPASLFAHAPRLHEGLLPGEYPAILKNNEDVRTPEMRRRDALQSGNYFHIEAVDAKSFADLVKRNPNAIIGVFDRAAKSNNQSIRRSFRRF